MNNRYGCTISKVKEFKELEEQVRQIKNDETPKTLKVLKFEQLLATKDLKFKKNDILEIDEL